MTIKAKFAGRCAACGGGIDVGDEIEWTKGSPARHSRCSRRSHASARRRVGAGRPYGRLEPGVVYASRPAVSRELREPGAGEMIIHRYTTDYEVGRTIHATRVGGGGGPDGHYWTVVAAGSHRISEYEDDTREGEILYDAIVRPATDSEAAACATRIAEATAAKTAREDALRAIETGESQDRGWSAPAGSRTIARDPGRPGSYASYPYLVATPDGTVYHIRPVYDDDSVVHRLPLGVTDALAAARAAGWMITGPS